MEVAVPAPTPPVGSFLTLGGVVLCKVRAGSDHVVETYELPDGRSLSYEQAEGFFSNPSYSACVFTIGWLCECVKMLPRERRGALLELYCGNGNHTAALAPYFGRVVGVEVHPRLVDAATRNVARNRAANAALARELAGGESADDAVCAVEVLAVPSAKFCGRALATKGQSLGSRAGGGGAEPFETILVDPPRSGLDHKTRKLVASFDTILYISCEPLGSLKRDMQLLGKSHEVRCDATRKPPT